MQKTYVFNSKSFINSGKLIDVQYVNDNYIDRYQLQCVIIINTNTVLCVHIIRVTACAHSLQGTQRDVN